MASDVDVAPGILLIAPFDHEFSQKSLSKDLTHFWESYVHKISLSKNAETAIVNAFVAWMHVICAEMTAEQIVPIFLQRAAVLQLVYRWVNYGTIIKFNCFVKEFKNVV